jgi:microfibrillar-associated protein 1
MTEEEKEAWLAANPKNVETKEKSKMAFMQKYYHKGAFFQEGSDDQFGTAGTHDIYKRDFSEGTQGEAFDKSTLPKAMQVGLGTFHHVI